jgi:hypothetical protein
VQLFSSAAEHEPGLHRAEHRKLAAAKEHSKRKAKMNNFIKIIFASTINGHASRFCKKIK